VCVCVCVNVKVKDQMHKYRHYVVQFVNGSRSASIKYDVEYANTRQINIGTKFHTCGICFVKI